MPLPPIAVEIAPAPESPALGKILLEACSGAVPETHCEEHTGEGTASALARVSWLANDQVRIELGHRVDARSVQRTLAFGEGDAAEERWRAAGLVIGTLVGELNATEATPAPEPPPPPEQPVAQPPAPTSAAPTPSEDVVERIELAPEPQRARSWMDAMALSGPATTEGPWSYGGSLNVTLGPDGDELFFPTSLRFALAKGGERGVATQFFSLGSGVGYAMVNHGRLRVELVGQVGAQFLRAEAKRDSESDVAQRWAVLARSGFLGVVALTSAVGLVGSADVAWMSTATRVDVGGTPQARVPAYDVALGLGFRLRTE